MPPSILYFCSMKARVACCDCKIHLRQALLFAKLSYHPSTRLLQRFQAL
jgi:hypothetical protein